MTKYFLGFLSLVTLVSCTTPTPAPQKFVIESADATRETASAGDTTWSSYGGDLSGKKYSPLNEINRKNVKQLQLAWTFASGHLAYQKENGHLQGVKTAYEATPILVDRTLYVCDPFNRVFALNPKTGQQYWTYDPKIDGKVPADFVCRGVSTWKDPSLNETEMCAREIIVPTQDSRLLALDSKTGKLCPAFGHNGTIDLREGMGDIRAGEYVVSSPPTIVKNLIVAGAGISDNRRKNAPSGVVRAFDAKTGKLVWGWNATPPGVPQKDASGNWTRATPNAWSVFTADEANDMVFIPTGNPAIDLYGADRKGFDTYGSSVVALRASTGQYLWHFQTVHHDLWDYDVPSQPVLFSLATPYGPIPALAQSTKAGHVFILDRRTGKPVPQFPVEERPVPQSDVPGEQTSATQPFPAKIPPLYKESLNLFKSLKGARCWGAARNSRFEGVFTPPALNGGISFPGAAGGTDWGGAAVDQKHQIMVLNQNLLPFKVTLTHKTDAEKKAVGPMGATQDLSIFPAEGAPYKIKREPVYDFTGLFPCVGSTAGELVAIDLNKGEIRWRKPLGFLFIKAVKGAPNMGGPLVTGGELIFIGASIDSRFRAFDLATGNKLWEYKLGAPATATPMTYSIDGEQYVVVAAGGHSGLKTKEDDKIMAFKLPR